MTTIHHDKILILDFGSQYTQLIARRIREIGVYCEIWPSQCTELQFDQFSPRGVILSGSHHSVNDVHAPRIPDFLLKRDIPLLGICYGMQALMQQLNGCVAYGETREFGYAQLIVIKSSRLFDHISFDEMPHYLDVWMSHGDRVTTPATDFQIIAATAELPIAGVAHQYKPWFGIQFHPEVTHTTQGLTILKQFVVKICGCETLWTPDNIIEEAVVQIQKTVGQDIVLLGLSGGVDSSVVAALLHRALGSQLICVFVDTGLLRYNEGDQVMQMMQAGFGIKVIRVNAAKRFFSALAEITDPEQKRKIIGNVFVHIFEEEAQKLNNVRWLAQGTIYPDVIESAASMNGHSQTIKSHHNVGGLPEKMSLRLLEPIRELFKDEVRKLGVALGLSHEMVYRHPFPGPGLGVRILGEVKPEYAHILAQADHIFIDELRKAKLYEKVSQAFAVFLPVRSVGVVGDARAYEWVIALRAVETVDFMTAHWAQLPHAFLDLVSRRIINEISHVSRVVYDISGKPPATIEWE